MIDKVCKKHLLIFIFLLIAIMIIPASFAEDTSNLNQTNGHAVAIDESDDIIADSQKDIYVSTEGDDDSGYGTQDSPYRTIEKALDESTAKINNIYIADGTYNEYGLNVKSNVNIIGNGNSIIDAQGAGNIFKVMANAITFTLKNITLQNANTSEYGGAICIRYVGTTIIDANLYVDSVKFINDYASYQGGAIYNVGGATVGGRHNDVSITNCEFINCGSKSNGVILTQSSTLIANCTFIGSKSYNPTSTYVGSSISIMGSSTSSNVVNITGCTFIGDSYTKGPGGVIYSSASDLGSIFINNNVFLLDEGYGIFASSDNSAAKINANNNWWGSNTPDLNRLSNNKNVKINSYAVLDLSADSEVININEEDLITVTYYNNGTDIQNKLIPTRNITLTATGGVLSNVGNTFQRELKANFTAESIGKYTITATVDNQTLSTEVFVRNLEDKTVILAENEVSYKDVTISVLVAPNGATGNVTFTLNGKDEIIYLENSRGNITINNLPIGEYDNIILNYNGDEYHNSSFTTLSFMIFEKYPADLTAKTTVEGSNVTIYAELSHNATGNVTFTLNGKNETIYLNEGKGSITISNLANNDYEIELTYNGDENYQKATCTVSFTVSNRLPTELIITPIVSGDNLTVVAKINETLASGNVSFYLNYKNHVINITNGVGILSINKLPNGIYGTAFYYNGDINYKPSNSTETITISLRKDSVLTAEAIIKNQAVTIDVDIDDIRASGNVTFTINGEEKVIDVIRSKGSITLENVLYGNYSLLLTYNGDINFNPSEYILNFEVIKYGYGKVLYVSTNGSDKNNGSKNAPLQTISKAIDVANNYPIVERILIYNGIYTDSDMVIERNIMIQGQNRERTIIDAQGNSIFEIYGLENDVRFFNITFKNGYNTNGGAIRDYGYNLEVRNCTFINNTAGDQGGAIYIYYNYSSIIDCIFIDNIAFSGGAVYVSGSSKITRILNSKFINNTAYSGVIAGGAIYNGARLMINNAEFSSNNALSKAEQSYIISGGDGGAIYNANELLVNNSQFRDNHAYYWGGAIKAGGYTYIYNSNFTENSAGSRGGAIHSSGSGSYSAWTTYVTGCNFESNFIGGSAYEGSTMIGGAICAESPTAIRDSSFANNTSPYGGAIYMRANAKYIDNCSFINNNALNGGAIYNNFTMSVISNSTFEANNATLGGAIYVSASRTISEDSFANLTSNTYLSNTAFKGGAIYSDAGYASPQELNIKYSEFAGNVAEQGREIYTTNRATIEYNAIVCDIESKDVINVVRECEGIVTLENNWWGINNPNLKDIIVGITIAESYAVLNLTTSAEKIADNETATLTAKLMWNDKSNKNIELIPYRSIALKAPNANLTNVNGVLCPEFESEFSSSINGTHKITAIVDNEVLSIFIVVNQESEIPKENVTLKVENIEITEGENATIVVYLPEYATGNVTVKDITVPVSSHTAVITIPDLSEGQYTFDVIYSGDAYFNNATTTVNVTVNPKDKKNATITVNDVVIGEGEKAIVVVTLPDDATGNVTVRDITTNLVNGTASVTISGLAAGNYTFDVIYSGDRNYNDATSSVDITVNPKVSPKEDATITIDAPAIEEGENATITVTLPNDASGNMTVENITLPLVNGMATFIIPDLPVGKNTLYVTYTGDEKYNEIQTSVTVFVKRDLSNAIYANASTGSDINGDGSKENPVKTIAKALSLVNEDGIIVLTGNFKGNGNTGIYLSSYINNITFIGMEDTVIDGGHTSILFSITDGYFTFENITFKNAYSSGYGAAIINQAGMIVVEDCTFTDNVAQGSAGIDNTGAVMIVGCNFTNNLATLRDGAALSSSGEMYIFNSVFIGNHAYQNGGAIKNYEEGYLYIECCEFIANEAGGSSDGSYGGAVYSWASHLEIYLSNFSDNYATTKGGSVYASFGNSVGEFYCYIMGCSFENSEALIGSTLFLESVVGEVSYNAFLDENNVIYTYGTKDTIDNNWWGANNPVWSTLCTGTIKKPSTYAVLNVLATPSDITTDSSAKLDYVFYWNGTTNSENISFIPLRSIELSSTGGELKDTAGYLNDGKFSTEFSSDESGTYEITAKVDNQEITIKINVEDSPVPHNETVVINAPDVVKYFHGPEMFVVTITDGEGNPLADESVDITLNGVKYTRETDANGTVSLPVNLNSGIRTATVVYNNTVVTANITILPTIIGEDLVKVFKNDSQYQASFVDSEGKALANTDVKFNINGRIYTRTTDKNGVAQLHINLPQGSYIITAMNLVTGENAANNITVLPRIVENNDITKYFKNGTQYTVKLIGDDGNPVGAGEVVSLNINGRFYNPTTDENGVAQLNINLPPGDYIITAEYKGCKVSNNIKVLPVLSAEDLTKKYGGPEQFIATLVDGQGKPYEGQAVTFNINGRFYNKITDSNGQAKLNIELLAGEYIITSSFNGANIANKVTVTA